MFAKLKLNVYRFVTSIVFLSFIILTLCGCSIRNAESKLPVAKSGILDLTGWDFEKNGCVELEGEWEFYWQQLLEPEDFFKPTLPLKTGYFVVPHTWDDYKLHGKNLPPHGYATYRLIIKTNGILRLNALKLPYLFSSYKLWANNNLVSSNGVVGKSAKEMQPQILPKTTVFVNEAKQIELVLQVSNFMERLGGFDGTNILIGTERQISQLRERNISLDIFLFGSLFIISIYHFGLFILRRKDTSSLYFALFCLIIAVRTICSTGERFFFTLLPGYNFELQMKISYMTYYLCIPVFLMFLKRLFPEEFSGWLSRILVFIALPFSLQILVTSVQTYCQTLGFYQILSVILAFYMLVIIIKASFKKRESSHMVLIGFFLLFLSLINDILYNNNIINTGWYASIGLLMFIIIQSFIVSRRFSKAFNTIEALSNRLLVLDKLKDEFLANTSHELKTPLNGIIGIAESMLDGVAGKLNNQQSANLTIISTSGKRLLTLVNDILDFSKLKNKDIILNLKPVDIKQVVQIVLELTKTLAAKKNLELINNIPDNLPLVDADENRLHQILYNLIGNAIKFTHSGFVKVTAQYKEGFIEVAVTDSGIGIHKSKFEDIFKSFEQVDGSISREYGGTGLGLSITKNIIEIHGGSIKVESEPGIGSSFIFTLPTSSQKQISGSTVSGIEINQYASESALVFTGPDSTKNENSHIRILAADDEPVNLQVLLNHLNLEGYSVTVVSNGMDALKKIQSGIQFDLVILDVMMPRMSGYEVCRILRERYSLSELPVLMLTAKNQQDDIIAGLEAGANDYLSKPFYKNELLARVQTLITLKKAVSEAVENARRFETEKQQRILSEALRDMAKNLSPTLELEGLLDRFLKSLSQIVSYDKALAVLSKPDEIRVAFTKGFDTDENNKINLTHLSKDKIIADVLRTKQPYLVSKLHKDTFFKKSSYITEDMNSLLGIPIIYQSKLYGILIILSTVPEAYSDREAAIAMAFASQAGVSFENAHLFKELNKRIDGIKNLLNNAGQGFLSFGSSLLIDNEYSQECETIFGSDIANKEFTTLLCLDNEQKKILDAMFIKVLDEENRLTCDNYITLLPKEAVVNGRSLNISYKKIRNANNHYEASILVIITDVTDKRVLENQVLAERNTLKMVVKAVTGYGDFVKHVKEFYNFCNKGMFELLDSQMPEKEVTYELFRKVHTFKGSFNQLDMLGTAEKLNDLEADLSKYIKNTSELSLSDLKKRLTDMDMCSWLDEDIQKLKNILGKEYFNRENVISIDSERLEELKFKMKNLLSSTEYKLLLPYIEKLTYKSFRSLIEPYQDYVERLSAHMGKPPCQLIVEGEDLFVDVEKYRDFSKSLVHIFRNIIDHGLEEADERQRACKSENSIIRCSFEESDKKIIISIYDDGRGIDLNNLRVTAAKMGIMDYKTAYALTNDEIINLIFMDGFTTSQTTSNLSGRGVGLSAVKSEVDKLNGTVTVTTHPGMGTEFRFVLPACG